MFPEEEELNLQTEEVETVGKSFLFDFQKGDFILKDGNLVEVEGIESLKVWIEKILKTEKFKFKIYDSEEEEYGITLLDLITNDYPEVFVRAEIQRVITEALLENTEINNVDNFSFTKDKRTLKVEFEVESIYGTLSEVIIY